MTTSRFAVRITWLITPVVAAGLLHVVLLKTGFLRFLAVPLDAGAHWRGQPLFGVNKTWRGPVVMTIGTAVAARLRAWFWDSPALERSPPQLGPWIAGALTGLAYALAELPNSFVKRRLGIAPGKRSRRFDHIQYLVDQTDSVLGCSIAIKLLYHPSRSELAGVFVLGTAVHIAVDLLMYALGLRRGS